MKLNLGCGYKKRDGFYNVDLFIDSLPHILPLVRQIRLRPAKAGPVRQ